MADKFVGIWIDHRMALLVSLQDGHEARERIYARMRERVGPSAGSRSRASYGPQDLTVEAKYERRYAARLRGYFEAVVRAVGDASRIVLFGPGTAKTELLRYLTRVGLEKRVVGVETQDRMTDPQAAAWVRRYFSRS